jgi:hypothetical protein
MLDEGRVVERAVQRPVKRLLELLGGDGLGEERGERSPDVGLLHEDGLAASAIMRRTTQCSCSSVSSNGLRRGASTHVKPNEVGIKRSTWGLARPYRLCAAMRWKVRSALEMLARSDGCLLARLLRDEADPCSEVWSKLACFLATWTIPSS